MLGYIYISTQDDGLEHSTSQDFQCTCFCSHVFLQFEFVVNLAITLLKVLPQCVQPTLLSSSNCVPHPLSLTVQRQHQLVNTRREDHILFLAVYFFSNGRPTGPCLMHKAALALGVLLTLVYFPCHSGSQVPKESTQLILTSRGET